MSTEDITLLVTAGGLVGAALNPFVTFLKTSLDLDNRRRLKFAVSFITSIGGGVLVAAISNKLVVDTLANILISSAVVFSASSIVYNLYWKDSKAEEKIQASITDN